MHVPWPLGWSAWAWLAPTSNAVKTDHDFMQAALAQAQLAFEAGEVPVGAVVVKDGVVIGAGFNQAIGSQDPCAHAEVVAIRHAAANLGNYRLEGCRLYVTLEPCAMCAGAAITARLDRVVFGATEPKTGAAGSVLNLFDEERINHHTSVTGDVCSAESQALLQQFFQSRRQAQKLSHVPLRDDALRTPEDCFANLPDYPWQPHYLSNLPSLNGLRMHYLDEPGQPSGLTYLCLHGNPAWSYLYRKMIPVFQTDGHRVVAPDLIGFGKSDKPKREHAHTFTWHRQVLLEFVEALDLQNVVLVVQDWGGLLGLTLPMAAPHRYRGLLVMNTTLATCDAPLSPGFIAWREMCAKNPDFDVARLFARGNPHMSAAECAAYMAPYPDRGYRGALRAFPPMVPDFEDADGAAVSRQAREFWQKNWKGQTLMAVGLQDPVLGLPVMQALRGNVLGCGEPMVLEQAGHFVQEHGLPIAEAAVRYFRP
jgi:tRNA(adenine34) deaminase